MTSIASIGRGGLGGIDEVRERRAAARATKIEPYRLDPLLPLREGRIKVWDPDALAVRVWEPWPNQEEDIVSWVDVDALADGRISLRNVHVEKSRQEGDTTAFAYAFLWVLTFWPVPLLMQHQDISKVADSGFTYDSFFGKIRLLWDHWPAELLRAPLAFSGGNAPVIRRKDVPTGYVTGEGQTPDPGRGGRYAGGLIDEAARIRWDKQGQAALTRAVPEGRVMLSTPSGEGNVYYELRRRRPAGWIYLRHHWTDHPLYSQGIHVSAALKRDTAGTVVAVDSEGDPGCSRCAAIVAGVPYDPATQERHRYEGKPVSPWYDDAVLELTDEQVAQELDIDYAASLTARVYPEFNEALHVTDVPIAYDPHLRVEIAWDFGVAPTAGAICQDSPWEYRVLADFEIYDATPETVCTLVMSELRSLGMDEKTLALRHEVIRNVGDPSVRAASLATARPLLADYTAQGFPIISNIAYISSTINAVKRLLGGRPKPLRVSPRAQRFIEHAKANRWPVDRMGNRKEEATEPENDRHNHMMRAFAYLVYDKWPFEEDAEQAAFDEARRRAADADPYTETGKVDPGLSYDTML